MTRAGRIATGFFPGGRPVRDLCVYFSGPGVDGLDGRLGSVLVRDWNIRVDVFSLDLVVVVDGGFLDARVLVRRRRRRRRRTYRPS